MAGTSPYTSDVLIIGAGAVGLSAAYQLSQAAPGMQIRVLEKAPQVAAHQTGHNSGVIHSGLYYRPGSLKAQNCITGRQALVAFARKEGIPHDICGKIVVASSEAELPQLEKIYATGLANGLDRIEWIGPEDIRAHEPYCRGVAGIWVPYTGIIDFPAVSRRLAERFQAAHSANQLHTGEEVLSIDYKEGRYVVLTPTGRYHSRFLIGCAGLQSDRIARLEGLQPVARIVGFRGDYYELAPHAQHKVRNLIYPVPDPNFPFLGVHFTRMIHGGVECGPNAVFSFSREGYARTAFNMKDSLAALTYSGTWNLFAKHWRKGWMEYRRAFAKRLFLRTLRTLIPDLQADELVRGRCGVRAVALEPDGRLVDDFYILRNTTSLHVLNAPSPAATASLAIGDKICQEALQYFTYA
jgi:L-2-hydroxyglutarate oxidase LhgO